MSYKITKQIQELKNSPEIKVLRSKVESIEWAYYRCNFTEDLDVEIEKYFILSDYGKWPRGCSMQDVLLYLLSGCEEDITSWCQKHEAGWDLFDHPNLKLATSKQEALLDMKRFAIKNFDDGEDKDLVLKNIQEYLSKLDTMNM